MIYRSKRAENFTVLGNGIFADNGLSFEAMGLLAYLLSKPDNWAVHPRLLAKVTEGTAQKRGENKIYALLRELIDAGYITRKRQASGEMHYFVYDEPQVSENKPHPSNPREANPREANPREANPREANPREDLSGVLISTERQQELNIKKERMGNKSAHDAHAETAGEQPLHDGEETTPVVQPKEKSAKPPDKRFNPLQALMELGVDRQVAEDWLAVRKAKLTKTALDGVVREAEKAGISVAEAVRICAERGWRGFKADWGWRSGGAPQGRVIDHTTGAVVDTSDPYAAAKAQAARVMAKWEAEGKFANEA